MFHPAALVPPVMENCSLCVSGPGAEGLARVEGLGGGRSHREGGGTSLLPGVHRVSPLCRPRCSSAS